MDSIKNSAIANVSEIPDSFCFDLYDFVVKNAHPSFQIVATLEWLLLSFYFTIHLVEST